ncbi:MAG: DUF3179 domain-containing protein [Actinomycetota bacterium]|nr:DUF3179 domain-containing protein [Actinomycetota bacterium]
MEDVRRTPRRTPRRTVVAAAAVTATMALLVTVWLGRPSGEVGDDVGGDRGGLPAEVQALAQEPSRDSGPAAVSLSQVAAGPRERTPSALHTPDAPGLPPPLVEPDQMVSGGPPPDGIPAIDEPRFQRTSDVRWVDDEEQVLVVEVAGHVRAYPVQVLTLHEVVNDTIGGIPVVVTYCPLCASGLAFERRTADRVLSFGTSGRLFQSNLVMYDRQTESLWPQVGGRAVAGVLTGQELRLVPAQMVAWSQWRAAHPDGWVLSRQTGHALPYGSNPYYGYDQKETAPLFYDFPIDSRIAWLKQPVVGIALGGDALAVDVEALRNDGTREVTVGGRRLTVWWLPGARSSLDGFAVGDGAEVGTVSVFDPVLNGRPATFQSDGGVITDVETGSTWDAFGAAVTGPRAGARLASVPHLTTFWFSWSASHPGTRIER